MKLYRFKTLSIISTKKPFNNGLIWEHTTYGIFMVDSTNQAVLLGSTKARLLVDGSDWDIIDLSDNTNSYKIQAGWLDGNDLWLVMCDNDGTADDFEVCFIELDDSNDCNPVAVSAGADVNTVYAFDIFKIGTDHFVINKETRAGVLTLVCWDVDAAFVEKDTFVEDASFTDNDGFYFGIVTGTKYYSFMSYENNLGPILFVQYDNSIPTFTIPVVAGIGDYRGPTDKNMRGVSYDGSDSLIFIGKQNADGKNYLITYAIGTSSTTIGTEYNISLQIDRNNSGTVPNELEKAFGTTDEIVYEIKPRRGGIQQLQDLSSQLSGNIVALTDNFLFAINVGGGWDIYEFTNIEAHISEIYQTNGIIGIRNRVNMVIHPDFQSEWSEKDSFKVYDPNDLLAFWGIITNKSRDARGIYLIQAESFSNEIYKTIYEKSYSGDDTDTKQKDIIDNGCNFNYRSSSIVGTTTTYDYAYNRAIAYLFYLGRFLERQIPYIEPDGKVWTKAYDGLAKNAQIYPGTYNFKDDDVGSEPAGFTPNNDANCTTIIIASLDGHRKVLQLFDNSVLGECNIYTDFTGQTSGTIEVWRRSDDVTRESWFELRDGSNTRLLNIYFKADELRYFDGAEQTIQGVSDNTWYHIRIDFDTVTETFDCYVDGVKQVTGGSFANNDDGSGVARIWMATHPGLSGYNSYYDAIGFSWDTAYNIGDNEVAWNLNNHWQEIALVDIPHIKEIMPGYFKTNLNITRATVRYRDNTLSIKPTNYLTLEETKGIIPLEEFRDPKIEASTEADQLADTLHDIFSTETELIGLKVEGEGFLQPGKTVEVANTGQLTITQKDYLILQWRYDLKNDIYLYMIISNNIVFPSELSTYNNTITMQRSQTTIQAFENQADIIAHLTPEGGLALRLTNKTGVASVKGTIIEAHAGTDNAFRVCDANSVESFGVVYEDGIADGSECLVVIGGRCQVLLKDATLSTRNNWVEVSNVAGRADATGASPAAAPQHFQEIGHAIESKGADTDVLAFIMLHFL